MSAGAAKLTFAIRAVNEAKAAMDEARRDLEGLTAAADQANGRFGAVGAALSGLGSSMQTVGKYAMAGMAAGVGAVAGGLGLALKSSADFEKQLNIVASVAGAAGSELAALRQTALDLGESTAYSAGEVTQAMEVLAANGISAKDIVEGAARAALDLAAAGSTSLVQAADTVSTAMAVWGLSTADLTDTVNRLAGAANVSRFGVEDMALAIAQGGGAASAAGVEFADFSAAIAAIAPLFASGSDAGTSFKTFIQRLVPDSKAAREAMMELGLITADGGNKFFDATGKMRPMAEVVDELNRAISNLSEKDRTRLLSNAFGTDAMRTAIGLSRLTKEEFIALQTAMGEASAAEIGQQRMQGLAGAMEQFKGALETARIEIGDRLNPIATSFFEALAGFVPTVKEGILNAMDRFAADVLPRLQAALDGVRGAWERFREPILQFLQSKEAAQIGLGMLAAVLLSVAVAAGSAAAGVLAAVAPVAALGLAIGGVIVIADKLGVDWARVWDGIREAAGRAADSLVPKVQAFADAAGSALRRFGSYWETELKPAIERVIAFLSAAFEKIGPVIRPVIEGAIQLFQNVASAIAENVKIVLEIVGRLVDIVVQLIQGDWSSAWNSAKELVRLALELIWNLIKLFPQQLLTALGAVLEAGKNLIGALADGLKWAWDNHVWPFLSGLPTTILGFFAGAGQWLLDIGKDIIRGLWDGLKSMWGEVEGWLGGIGGKIKSIKGPPEKDRVLLYDIGKMIMEGLSNGLFDGWSEDTVKKLKEISRGLVRNYEDAVKELEQHTVPDWRQLGELLSQALAQGHFDGFKKNKPLLEQVARELTASAGQAGEAIGEELARVLNMTGKRLEQALLDIRDLMVTNLESGKELTVKEVRTLLEAMEDMLESPTLPEAARQLGQNIIDELIASLKAGKGAANEVIARLADELAKAAAQGAKAAAAGSAGAAGWRSWDDGAPWGGSASKVGLPPDLGGVAPVGAHGVQLVWDDRAQAWVYPWEKGSVPSPAERAAYMERWQRGETLAGAIPQARPIVLELNGREVARALLPDVLDEAERQGVALA